MELAASEKSQCTEALEFRDGQLKMTSNAKDLIRSLKQFAFACVLAGTWAVSPAGAVTTFINHFDTSVPTAVGLGAGPADYAVGSPNEVIGPPSGPGGPIVSGGKWGNALSKSNGGRVEYATAGNYNVNKGTIEMWIKGPGIDDTHTNGLWGTDTTSGNGDIRMYIYNSQVNDGLRTLGAYQLGAGGFFWEIEEPIPANLLDNTNWHHVAWAFDTNAGTTATWWDGQLLGNTPDQGFVNPRTTFNNTRFHIGEVQGGSAPWPGLIDEFRISDSVVYDMNSNFTPPTAPFAAPSSGVAGDYNNNGRVDAADYTVWRDNLGASNVLPNDSTPGLVTVDDYNVWKSNFGLMAASGVGTGAAVPEPRSEASAVAALGLVAWNWRRLRNRSVRKLSNLEMGN
jgi:hypothetical protein